MLLACGCTDPRPRAGMFPLERSQDPPPTTGPSCNNGESGPGPGPQPRISEGIMGVVCFWEGDFMPSIGGPPGGKIDPVRRKVEIHAASRDSDTVKAADGSIQSVSTPLITTVTSGEDGWFEAAVPPGTYSIFVHENGNLYANSTSSAGIITPVEVDAGAVARTQFDITYKATY